MNTERLTLLSALLLILVTIAMTTNVLAVQPFGANYTQINSTRAPIDQAQDHEAIAGNVTELDISGFSTTQTWQGYFGNVSGTIQLADSADNVMYNWSLADPEGEVYATENSSVNWVGVACAVNATDGPILESMYGIASDDVDGVDETFYDRDHDLFYVNNVEFSQGECDMVAWIYGDDGQGNDDEFEEVIIKGGDGEYIFTSLLEESPVLGFDNRDHDFEMLVLEDGHGTDTDTTTYYFYVELE